MVFWYKNSVMSSVVSILGCVMAIAGFAEMMIPVGLLGIALAIWGKIISDNKAFKTWWKQVTDNNLEPRIAQSVDVAMQIYNKNPQGRTLKKIEELNPEAANQIRARKAAGKK